MGPWRFDAMNSNEADVSFSVNSAFPRWYTGADPGLIAPNQYDMESTATHEIGESGGG